MSWKRTALLARKRSPAGKSPALPKYFFSFKTPDLETRASTPEQFKLCCVRRALIQRRKERAKRRYPPQAERINAFRSEQAARARKYMRQEMPIEPGTGSTPEFLKIEEPGNLR